MAVSCDVLNLMFVKYYSAFYNLLSCQSSPFREEENTVLIL